MTGTLLAQPKGYNYDEDKVPQYTLPDALTCEDGTKVTTPELWTGKRRPELVKLFEENVYGVMPPAPIGMTWRVYEQSDQALGGKATRKQIAVYFTGYDAGPRMTILVYIPNKRTGPAPAFIGLNFQGNHAVINDPAVTLNTGWMHNRGDTVKDNRATEAARGVASSRWPIEMIVDRGYAIATIYYGDIDPDFDDGFHNGIHAKYPQLQGRDDNFTSIGAWSWGLSRALDVFEQDDDIDAKRVAVIGHSRLGKTSLWAGASDERFAMVVSNCSGCGGAALSRRAFGETVKRINTSFPHWFCANFKKYNDNEGACPVDQHELIALIAPRPVYVASAEGDQWADPHGEFLSAQIASRVYDLLGKQGIAADASWPKVDQPLVTPSVGYHMRTGKHDLTEYDWKQYLDFADKRVK
ncbi:MAG: acetylxylan esterase [Phycisphaera sp.]|nr:acetylxylan esterase [Phycisphaera sp.]